MPVVRNRSRPMGDAAPLDGDVREDLESIGRALCRFPRVALPKPCSSLSKGAAAEHSGRPMVGNLAALAPIVSCSCVVPGLPRPQLIYASVFSRSPCLTTILALAVQLVTRVELSGILFLSLPPAHAELALPHLNRVELSGKRERAVRACRACQAPRSLGRPRSRRAAYCCILRPAPTSGQVFLSEPTPRHRIPSFCLATRYH